MNFAMIMLMGIVAGASVTYAQEVDCKNPPLHLHAEHCCDMPRTRAQFLTCAEKFHKSVPPLHHMHHGSGFRQGFGNGYNRGFGQGFNNQGFGNGYPQGYQGAAPEFQQGYQGAAPGFQQGYQARFRRQAAQEPEQCFIDCLLNTTNVIQDDTVDREKAVNALEQVFQDQEWNTGIPVAVDACINHIQEFKSHIESIPQSPDSKCSNYGKFFVGCLNRQLLANCPANFWSDREDCNLVKSFIQNCDESYLLKGPHHGGKHH